MNEFDRPIRNLSNQVSRVSIRYQFAVRHIGQSAK